MAYSVLTLYSVLYTLSVLFEVEEKKKRLAKLREQQAGADEAKEAAVGSTTNPRNPRHFGTIEGGRNSVSGGRTTKNTQSP